MIKSDRKQFYYFKFLLPLLALIISLAFNNCALNDFEVDRENLQNINITNTELDPYLSSLPGEPTPTPEPIPNSADIVIKNCILPTNTTVFTSTNPEPYVVDFDKLFDLATTATVLQSSITAGKIKAYEFNNDKSFYMGDIYNYYSTGSIDMSISTCPGDFDVPPECKVLAQRNPGLFWSRDGSQFNNPASATLNQLTCNIGTDKKVYLNIRNNDPSIGVSYQIRNTVFENTNNTQTMPILSGVGSDPGIGSGLWIPPGSTNRIVADQSGPTNLYLTSFVPGCLNGSYVTMASASGCGGETSYTGKIYGTNQNYTFSFGSGKILTLRYKSLSNANSAMKYITLDSGDGGNVGQLVKVWLSTSPTATYEGTIGDFCKSESKMQPFVVTGPGYCQITPNTTYYLHISVDQACTSCRYKVNEGPSDFR